MRREIENVPGKGEREREKKGVENVKEKGRALNRSKKTGHF